MLIETFRIFWGSSSVFLFPFFVALLFQHFLQGPSMIKLHYSYSKLFRYQKGSMHLYFWVWRFYKIPDLLTLASSDEKILSPELTEKYLLPGVVSRWGACFTNLVTVLLPEVTIWVFSLVINFDSQAKKSLNWVSHVAPSVFNWTSA